MHTCHQSSRASSRRGFVARLPFAALILPIVFCFVPSLTALAADQSPTPPAAANGGNTFGVVEASGLLWQHLSSRNGDLPVPGESAQQTGAIVANLANDPANGFVLSFRQKAPALLWYRRTAKGWDRYVIDKDFLTVEAGGVAYDIDGDGLPDLLFGADWQGGDVWWWKNPGPPYSPNIPWKRYTIKHGGATQHHDQIIGDFKGTGKAQVVYWNQGAHKLFIADIPPHPTEVSVWPATEVFSGSAGENPGKYAEGVDAADMEGNGRTCLLAGNYWFKYLGDNKFKAIRIGEIGGRIAAAHLIKGSKIPQVVIASGDGIGPLKWYECKGDPEKTEDWVGHDLLGRVMVHGHSLQIADIDGDGNLDIFTAEMAKWSEARHTSDNPKAQALIFYGDGKGNFRKTVFATGIGFHEARVADLNGDGRMDILDKPYNWEAPDVEVWLQLPRNGHSQTLAAPILAAAPAAPGPDGAKGDAARHAKIEVGLQLYSVRALMDKQLVETLDLVHKMHITDVEVAGLYGKVAPAFRAELDKDSLKASGVHFQYDRFSNDIDGVIKDAKALGCEYVTLPWIPHKGDFTADDAKAAAEKFNEWGKKCADAGLKFTYHPHGYEFHPYKDGTVFDVLVAATKPEYVNYELDIFWAFDGGADPVKLMQKYPTRFPLMHLKDMKKGVKTPNYTGGENVESDVALGTGQLDIPAILAEAEKIGVKHYYIEDESSRSVEQIPKSIEYIRSIGF
ncbi:MAG TPA: TIM barrel protein [Tepidisphaeraceae bacterium]|jgi:sugar phosphate isomerase/epimerase|nr:TIM barrel protein [Tepidisphaeraceae bacterium]